ncbi:hypothetical protein Tco_1023679 [Tanacetum coccineum]
MDLHRYISLDSVVVLRYEKGVKVKNKGNMLTEMELVLEQTQQEHQSDTQVIIVKIEILLEPTSNKLMVGYELMIDDELLNITLSMLSYTKTTLAVGYQE